MSGTEFLKSILIPVDRSASSLMAEDMAAKIAKKTGAKVTVLHVILRGFSYVQSETTYTVPEKISDEILGSLEQEAEKIVSNARDLFGEEKVLVDTEILREDDAADTILKYSEEDFDLIIMGAHGENEKDPYALGSVTKRVTAHAKCPVLITKKASSLSKMLVGVDGSRNSTKALEYAVKLAEKMGSEITMLNVQEHRLHKASPEVAEELGDKIFSKASDAIGKQKLKIEKRLEIGVTSDKIFEVAEKGNYDLIVLGSRGLGTVKRFLLGSISDDVSHKAKCSVLIVPQTRTQMDQV